MILLTLALCQTASIAAAERKKLDESSKIFCKYNNVVDLFLDSCVGFEDEFRWLCEFNLLTDGKVFQESEDGKAVRRYSQNSCRKNQRYEQRFGEDEHCRWAIDQRSRKHGEKVGNYKAIKESFAAMLNSFQEMVVGRKKPLIVRTF